MNDEPLRVGKLPVPLLVELLAAAPCDDPDVLLGPGVGLDCAVVEVGGTLLAFKSDPITFATDEIGWYAVQVNANDIATTGATPRWFLATVLLPEGKADRAMVTEISRQMYTACEQAGIAVIGGHSEVTSGLDRPIVVGTMIGEVSREKLITPQGTQPGDRILLTKGVPIEATAILARELPDRLRGALTPAELERAAGFLHDPGIGVLRDAQIAVAAGQVTAMHDPTEGGLATALWELADASGRRLVFDPARVPVPSLSYKVCAALGLDPLASIASGALLLTAVAADAPAIQAALEAEGIPCQEIGRVEAGDAGVWQGTSDGLERLPRPERDAITVLFEKLE